MVSVQGAVRGTGTRPAQVCRKDGGQGTDLFVPGRTFLSQREDPGDPVSGGKRTLDRCEYLVGSI